MGIFNRVSAAEHDRVTKQRDEALTDLAESAFRIEALEADLRSANADAEEWKAAALAYQPDAEAMRAKRKRDRDLKAEKAKAAAAPKAASKKAVRK